MAQRLVKCKTTCCFARCDKLGRIVIPRELRKTLGIEPGDQVGIMLIKGTLVIRLLDQEYEDDGIATIAQTDTLGRITIPAYFRRVLGLTEGIQLEILGFMQNEEPQLQIRAYYPSTQIEPHLDAIQTINQLHCDCDDSRQIGFKIEEHLSSIRKLLRELDPHARSSAINF